MIKRLKPTYVVSNILDINLQTLKNDGIKGFLFDLDNTVMEPKTGKLKEDMEKWLAEVKNDFKIAIVSNNTDEEYLIEAQKNMNCPFYGSAKKPDTKVAAKALKELGLLPSNTVMVGDRPLTDIWVGQRLGMITILVDPLRKNQEGQLIKFLRWLERLSVNVPERSF